MTRLEIGWSGTKVSLTFEEQMREKGYVRERKVQLKLIQSRWEQLRVESKEDSCI